MDVGHNTAPLQMVSAQLRRGRCKMDTRDQRRQRGMQIIAASHPEALQGSLMQTRV